MKMIFKLLFVLISSISFANSRLEDVKRHYNQELETAIGKDIEILLGKASLQLDWLAASISSRLDSIVYDISQEATHFAARKFKSISQRYDALETRLQGFKADISRIEFEHSRIPNMEIFKRQNACEVYRDQLAIGRLPQRPDDRKVWVNLPKPEILKQIGIFESQHGPAGETGATVFTALASSGCGVGASIGVWFFGIGAIPGCLIGAGVGAGVGAAAGAATTHIMTDQHNIDEYKAYVAAYRREEAKQKKEMSEADAWAKAHPIDAAYLMDRAYHSCMNRADWSVFERSKNTFQALKLKIEEAMLPKYRKELKNLELDFQLSAEENQIYLEKVSQSKSAVQYFDQHLEPLLQLEHPNTEIKQKVRKGLDWLEVEWPNHLKMHPKIKDRTGRARAFLENGETE
jgi:hypothetical protein